MATVIAPPPALSGELALFQTTDPLLGNSTVLVFHGPAATLGAASSRIQVHILTLAGLGSYNRLSISPASPFYSAVSNLPREEQGDEVCRGIAFGLKKYFTELSDNVKQAWRARANAAPAIRLFEDDHVAILATRMVRVDSAEDVITDVNAALGEQKLPWLDIDVVLPPGAMQHPTSQSLCPPAEDLDNSQMLRAKYGRYADVITAFGEVAFLPTSKLKRAPSKATAIGRSLSFLKQQKQNVRKEFCELVKTEENYIDRLAELEGLSTELRTSSENDIESRLLTVFPPTIPRIQELNKSFLNDIDAIFRTTEDMASGDIEVSTEEHSSNLLVQQDFTTDTQGILALAKCLCDWFPKLAECYKEYLQVHAKASQSARAILREQSSVAARLRDLGEQKLTSLLIEPVQRLPRYNLYIDSIVKQLPARHPAIKLLLKARDMVTDICAHDDQLDGASTVEKLRSRISGWPVDANVHGRLITALDFVEMPPPYSSAQRDGSPGMLLLFTDGILVLSKKIHSTMSARVLLTELEASPLQLKPIEKLPEAADELQFTRKVGLDALQCTEALNGHVVQLITFFQLAPEAIETYSATSGSCTMLWLQNAYDGKASRFIEEICKARIEGAFGEPERESATWEFHATDAVSENVGLLSAIYEESNSQFLAARKLVNPIRVVVDPAQHERKSRAGDNGVRTVITLSPGDDGLWCIKIDSLDCAASRDYVEVAALLPYLRRRLATLMSIRLAIEQPAMTATLLSRNEDILRSIELSSGNRQDEEDEKPQLTPRERFHRPKSPKKLLSSLLSSVGPGNESMVKKELLPPPALTQIPRIQPPTPQKPPSRESRPSSKDQATPISITSMQSNEKFASSNRLEETLSAYILALQARKGNIVGKSLKARNTADELSVNELYNELLEDPSMMVLAAQAPVDVLFAAFEKFLNNAWREQLGNIAPHALLQEIQLKAETLFPVDFDTYFKSTMASLTPPNQRAFRNIMKLLADLLDGTGNDSDRGILTAAFAEVLVSEGNPHDYIALIDRFVDDTDTYFGEPLEEVQSKKDGLHKRSGSVNSASITSNTSSLRRKFGFGTLSRENSRSEQESKVASVWRTLSKNSRSDASQSRSQATDLDLSWHSSRPSSRDGPKTSQQGDTPSLSRATSTHDVGLSTIGEHPSFIPMGPPRKKRRSSLSDLKAMDTSPHRELWAAPAPRHPYLAKSYTTGSKTQPKDASPTTPPSHGSAGLAHTPSNFSPRPRVPLSFQRESSLNSSQHQQRPKSSGGKPNDAAGIARQTTNIPSLVPRSVSPQKRALASPERGGLSERSDAGNIIKKPSPQPEKTQRPKSMTISQPTASPPKKLRMQSPQKLRERLQNEQRAIAAAQNSLQDELGKIGDELTATAVQNKAGSSRGHKIASLGSGSQPRAMDLAQRVLKMEGQVPTQFDELNQRITSIQADLATSLSVSEAKCKKLDDLYREANGENEAVYARFNDELSRILKAVRGGDGVEELKRKLKESQDEAAKLRRETSRLKRENAGLRAQLKE